MPVACGLARKAELLTGLEGASSQPVRKIVLRGSNGVARSLPLRFRTAWRGMPRRRTSGGFTISRTKDAP